MTKLITFCVPSYNSEAYLHTCIDSLLTAGEDVEIIIVNDGSKDKTSEIAHAYEEKYPTIVRAIDKPNGGHGSGVNKGIELATGIYYKVVDSDDWVDVEALKTLISKIKEQIAANNYPDLILTNYVFDHPSDNTSYTQKYTKHFPVDKTFTWDKFKDFKADEFIMMHAMYYRLEVLKKSGMILPEHTFYVDNIYTYQPLMYVDTMYYLDIDVYHYFIGREDQSVNAKNMVKRYDQQLRVISHMLLAYKYEDLKKQPKHKYRYLIHDLINKLFTTLFFVYGEVNKEKKAAYKAMWKEIKAKDKPLYNKIRHRTLFIFPCLMITPLIVFTSKLGYSIVARKKRWAQ